MPTDISERSPLLLHSDSQVDYNPDNTDNNDYKNQLPVRSRDWLGPVGLVTKAGALLLMSLVGFGAFFCFDNPGALQTEVNFVFYIMCSVF